MIVYTKTILSGDLWKDNPILGRIVGKGNEEDIDSIKVIEIDFCCDEMKLAFEGEDKFVGFGDYEFGADGKDNSVAIYHCSPWSEGASWDSMVIRFCPFCGTKIDIENTETVKLKKKLKTIPAKKSVEYIEVPKKGE